MVGRVAHTTTGVCIDLFAYGPVSQARPWQKDPRYSQITWWERKNDHAESGPEVSWSFFLLSSGVCVSNEKLAGVFLFQSN